MKNSLEAWQHLLTLGNIELVDHPGTGDLQPFSNTYLNTCNKPIDISESVEAQDLNQDECGNLHYNDTAVLAYIRRGRSEDSTRKVHFTYCTTIKELPAGKFFCTTRSDGLFEVDIEDESGNLKETKELKLAPCEYCVGQYYGLTRTDEDREERKSKVRSFEFNTLLNETRISLNKNAWKSKLYEFTNKSWTEVSRDARENAGWTCEECNTVVGEEGEVFLHTHHMYGDRNFNHRINLKVLCIKCHAEEPGHESLKGSSQYNQYIKNLGAGMYKAQKRENSE